MPVDSIHPQYSDSLSKWKMARDCVKGAKAIKAATLTYLRNPDPEADDAAQRYADYLQSAQFLNVTARTKNAMVGMAFRKDSEIELPSQIEYLTDNATGDGLSIEQLGKKAVGDLLITGRYGLLADYPKTEAGQTAAQTSGIQASIKTYPAESIINWATETVNGQSKLTLVVLKETAKGEGDEFQQEDIEQYRVLMLLGGVYTVYIWRDDSILDTFSPSQGNGQTFDVIPFVMAGAYANDPDVDDAPLIDIAEVNVGHYRNSADYEESVFLVGQPQAVISGLTQTWVDKAGGTFKFGSRNAWTLPEGGGALMLQAQPNSMAMEAMIHKEAQMVSIGARLIQATGQAETAEAARIKHAGDNSVLANVVGNASLAIAKAVTWCGMFMGVSENEEVTFVINSDFYEAKKQPADIMAEIQLYDRQIIAKTDIRKSVRKAGIIATDRTDEDIEGEVEQVSPLL